MKKLAVVLGVAAVATLTGCRDCNYDAKHGKQVQDEPKYSAPTPVETPVTPKQAEPAPTEIRVETTKCTCPPGTKHTTPCACGASDCHCVVEKPVETKPVETKPVETKPAEPETTVYIVQNGDYLAKISKKYNVTISSIKRLNNLKDDTIRVGQKLKLPGKIDVGVQTAPTVKSTATTTKKGFTPYTGATKEYVVKNGDTLGAVAYGNGCNIRQLKQLNNLTSDTLKVGQKLKVPADKNAAKAAATTTAEKTVAATTAKPVAAVEAKPAVTTPAPVVTTPAPAVTTPAPTPDVTATAPTAVVEPPTTPSVATTTYVVEEGEDLTKISIDFGVTTSVIRELNNLGENDVVKPGQVLKLPADSQQ